MQVLVDFMNKENTFDDFAKFLDFWRSMVQVASEKDRVVSQILIDGEQCGHNIETYIEQNFERIQRIQVDTAMVSQVFEQTLLEIKDYVPKLVLATDSISELFYVEMNEQGWSIFTQMVEGMNWLYQALELTASSMEKDQKYSELRMAFTAAIRRLSVQFAAINEALDQQDYVTVGDIVKYELSDIFQELQTATASEGI